MKKRVVSILLCAAIVIGVLPLGLLTLPAAADTVPGLTNLVGRWDGDNYYITFDKVEGAVRYNFNWSMTLGTTRYASSFGDTIMEVITKPYFYVGKNANPPFWVTITAENKYGEDIARSQLNIKAPFEATLDTPKNVYLSPTGVLTFDPVEHAGAYEVGLEYKGTYLQTYQYTKIPAASPYVDLSDWVCEKDGEYFMVAITSYAEGFPETRYGKYRESTYTINNLKYSSETELSGSVTINSDRTVTYGHYLKYLNERTSTPLHIQWQHYNSDAEDIENAWVNITESQKTSYPVQELRVIVTADGHEGSVTSKDNNYTDKDHPYVATSFKDLVRVFNRDHDNDKTIYIKLGCDISVTKASGYLEAKGGDVDLDLNGYTLYYRGTTRALIRAGYMYDGEPAEVFIRDSRRYDSSKGEWVDGKVVFDHDQVRYHYSHGSTTGYSDDYLEYCGLETAVLTGDITVYGGVFINESHKSYLKYAAHEAGTLCEYVYGEYISFYYDGLKMYGGTFQSSWPVRLESNSDGDEYGFYGGTIKSSGEWAVEVVIRDKENYSLPSLRNIKVINESANEQIAFLNMHYINIAGDVDSTRAFADLNGCYLSAAASYTDGVKNSFATENMLYIINKVAGPLFSDTYEIKTEIALKSLEFDITEPAAGEIPNYTLEGPESDLYTTQLVWKYERTPNTFRELEDEYAPFRTGLYYRAEVILTPEDGVTLTSVTGTHTIGSHVADTYSNDGSYYFYSNYRLRDIYFDIYIGGTQVGRLNKGDVIGDGGSVQFFEKGEYTQDPFFKNSKVLVFNNFNMIKNDYSHYENEYYGNGIAHILIEDDISVIVHGENSIGGYYSTANGICVGNSHYVSFYGDGSFTVDETWCDKDAMLGFGSSVFFNDSVEFNLRGRYGARLVFDHGDTADVDLWDNAKVSCYAHQTEDDRDYPALKVGGTITIMGNAELICEQQYNEDAMSTWGDNFPTEYYDVKILKKGEFAKSQTNPVQPYAPPVGFNMAGGVYESECRYVSIKGKTVYATGISISPSFFTLTPDNNSRRVTATLLPSYAPAFYDDLTWESSDESVVQVSKDGNRTATISGRKNGTATVTATAPGGASTSVEVTVSGFNDVISEISSVEITANAPAAGDVPSFTAAVPEGAAYKIDDFTNEYFLHGVSWNYGDETSSNAIPNNNLPVFEAGETYTMIVALVPTDPSAYAFADQAHLSATVNGAQATAYPLASRLYVTCTFTVPQEEMCDVYWYLDASSTDYTAGAEVPRGTVFGNPPEPAREDANFAGWYTDRGLTMVYDPTAPITQDTELFPRWEANGQQNWKRGDVNQDGVVDAKDALMVLKAAVGKIQLTPIQVKLANVNGDNTVDAKDALMILKISVGKAV